MERRVICDHCGASFSILGDTDLTECPKCGWIVNVDGHQQGYRSTKGPPAIPGPVLTHAPYHHSAPELAYEPGAGVVVFGWMLFALVIALPFIAGDAGRALSGFGVLISILLVAVDASHIRVKHLEYSTLNLTLTDRNGPVAWPIMCWILWIPIFPIYLAKRQKLARAAHETIANGLYVPFDQRDSFRKHIRKGQMRRILLLVLLVFGGTIAAIAFFGFLGSIPEDSLDGHSDAIDNGLQGIEHYRYGLWYLNEKNIDFAEEEFRLAIKENPNLAEAHLNLGLIALENGWFDGAEMSTRRCIDILERTRTSPLEGANRSEVLSVAYNNMGALEMARAQRAEYERGEGAGKEHWQTGMGHFRKAVQLDGSNSKAQGNIARFKGVY